MKTRIVAFRVLCLVMGMALGTLASVNVAWASDSSLKKIVGSRADVIAKEFGCMYVAPPHSDARLAAFRDIRRSALRAQVLIRREEITTSSGMRMRNLALRAFSRVEDFGSLATKAELAYRMGDSGNYTRFHKLANAAFLRSLGLLTQLDPDFAVVVPQQCR